MVDTTVRAWKDPAFRATVGDDVMSGSPVGAVSAPDDLAGVFGGDHRPWTFHTCFTCITCNYSCRSACMTLQNFC